MASAVGLIYFLPNILMPYFLGNSAANKYCPLCNTDEGFAYTAGLQDVVDGHWFEGDQYLYEYKNMPGLWDTKFMAMALGIFMKIFNIKNVSTIFIYGDFIFPAIGYLLAFFLFFKIIGNKLISYLSALLLISFPNFFAYKELLNPAFYSDFSLLKLISIPENVFNPYYSRLFVPALSMIFFIAFLIFLYSVLTGANSRKYLLPAAISFGALFYVYLYYWVFATISLGLLFVFSFFHYRKNAFGILKILIGGYLISIPYWMKFFILKQNPIYKELSERVGMEIFRAFKIDSLDTYILVIFMAGLLYFFGRAFGRIKTSHYLNSLLLTVIIVLNLQIILGFNIQTDHWGSRVNGYILALGLLVLLFWAVQYIFQKVHSERVFWGKRIFNFLIIIGLIFFSFIGVIAQINYSSINAYEYSLPRYLTESFDWINKNTPKDSVFVTLSTDNNYYLPIFTHANAYNPSACRSLAGEKEILHRFLESYRVFGISPDNFKKIVYSDIKKSLETLFHAELGGFLFCVKYPEQSKGDAIPDEVKQDLVSQYKLFKKLSIEPKDLKFRADYLFFGPSERLLGAANFKNYKNLKEVYKNDSVSIYKINQLHGY